MLRVTQEAYKASQLITNAIFDEFWQFENGGRKERWVVSIVWLFLGRCEKKSFHSSWPPTTDKQGFHPGLAS